MENKDLGRVAAQPGSRAVGPEPAGAVSAEGADPSREDLRAEISNLKETNRRLHRRCQQDESPWIKRAQKAERSAEIWTRAWRDDFERLCAAHQEIKRIFMLFWPNQEQRFNSVMDWRWGGKPEAGAVYANLLKEGGGGESIRVLDYIASAIEARRAATGTGAAVGESAVPEADAPNSSPKDTKHV